MQKTVLVIGGTGYLGGKVVQHLLDLQMKVRALVRPRSDATALELKGVDIFRGDITQKQSLYDAMTGIDALITTAIGYTHRKKEDNLKSVDDTGNKNIADVALELKIPRFVFTSILTCDQAPEVPHFWQKKRTEDYFDAIGLNYVSLRPGAFLDQQPKMDFNIKGLKKGKLTVFGSTTAKWTNILTEDLAQYLALAAMDDTIPFAKMDIGMDEPMNAEMLVHYASEYTGRTIKAGAAHWAIAGTALSTIGLFKPLTADLKKMYDYFFTGQYVADTTLQQKYFGKVPSVRDSVFRYCQQIGL